MRLSLPSLFLLLLLLLATTVSSSPTVSSAPNAASAVPQACPTRFDPRRRASPPPPKPPLSMWTPRGSRRPRPSSCPSSPVPPAGALAFLPRILHSLVARAQSAPLPPPPPPPPPPPRSALQAALEEEAVRHEDGGLPVPNLAAAPPGSLAEVLEKVLGDDGLRGAAAPRQAEETKEKDGKDDQAGVAQTTDTEPVQEDQGLPLLQLPDSPDVEPARDENVLPEVAMDVNKTAGAPANKTLSAANETSTDAAAAPVQQATPDVETAPSDSPALPELAPPPPPSSPPPPPPPPPSSSAAPPPPTASSTTSPPPAPPTPAAPPASNGDAAPATQPPSASNSPPPPASPPRNASETHGGNATAVPGNASISNQTHVCNTTANNQVVCQKRRNRDQFEQMLQTESAPPTSLPPRKPRRADVNYASFDCGAKIRKANVEMKAAAQILAKDPDKYMLTPCNAPRKYVIIELCEDVRVHHVSVANLEFLSSGPKEIHVLGSAKYPTRSWRFLGAFNVENMRQLQHFFIDADRQAWVRYVQLRIVSHHGDEHYCTVTSVQVFGHSLSDALRGTVPSDHLTAGSLGDNDELLGDDASIVRRLSGVDGDMEVGESSAEPAVSPPAAPSSSSPSPASSSPAPAPPSVPVSAANATDAAPPPPSPTEANDKAADAKQGKKKNPKAGASAAKADEADETAVELVVIPDPDAVDIPYNEADEDVEADEALALEVIPDASDEATTGEQAVEEEAEADALHDEYHREMAPDEDEDENIFNGVPILPSQLEAAAKLAQLAEDQHAALDDAASGHADGGRGDSPFLVIGGKVKDLEHNLTRTMEYLKEFLDKYDADAEEMKVEIMQEVEREKEARRIESDEFTRRAEAMYTKMENLYIRLTVTLDRRIQGMTREILERAEDQQAQHRRELLFLAGICFAGVVLFMGLFTYCCWMDTQSDDPMSPVSERGRRRFRGRTRSAEREPRRGDGTTLDFDDSAMESIRTPRLDPVTSDDGVMSTGGHRRSRSIGDTMPPMSSDVSDGADTAGSVPRTVSAVVSPARLPAQAARPAVSFAERSVDLRDVPHAASSTDLLHDISRASLLHGGGEEADVFGEVDDDAQSLGTAPTQRRLPSAGTSLLRRRQSFHETPGKGDGAALPVLETGHEE